MSSTTDKMFSPQRLVQFGMEVLHCLGRLQKEKDINGKVFDLNDPMTHFLVLKMVHAMSSPNACFKNCSVLSGCEPFTLSEDESKALCEIFNKCGCNGIFSANNMLWNNMNLAARYGGAGMGNFWQTPQQQQASTAQKMLQQINQMSNSTAMEQNALNSATANNPFNAISSGLAYSASKNKKKTTKK